MIKEKIIVKDFKCFNSDGGGFEKIFPLNIIIGKNNSGKSSLIELIEYMILRDNKFFYIGRNHNNSIIEITHQLTSEDIEIAFLKNIKSNFIEDKYENDYDFGKQYINKFITYQIINNIKNKFLHLDCGIDDKYLRFFKAIVDRLENPFKDKLFRKINAERDIVPEVHHNDLVFDEKGIGSTNFIHQILNRSEINSFLIEGILLNALNQIVRPDIEFDRILTQWDKESNKWEIYFQDSNMDRIPLSKMGSGIKTILLVLLNLLVWPIIIDEVKDKFVFAFEELENNLHPSLQRRLYEYIKKYSEENSVIFFLTTHSNIVIDTFTDNTNSQIIHLINNESNTIVKTISSSFDALHVLSDLGIKASDLLQCNGIIWVEGPSDRIFIKKWLELLAPNLKEGLHFSIVFYGGKLLSNLSFKWNDYIEKLIPILSVNKNCYILIDRDARAITSKINATKDRINSEIGVDSCWITEGREIENYLSNDVIIKWLSNKSAKSIKFKNEKYTKLEENIKKCDSKIKIEYNKAKNKYSQEIVEYIDLESLDTLNLKVKLYNLIDKIQSWNS